MKPRERDAEVCRRIIKEIGDVEHMLAGHTEKEFLDSTVLQKATVMSLLNIGELTKSFTDDFLDATPWMPWQDIRAARNLAAHTYYALDMDDVWETYRADLPELKKEMHAALERLHNGWDVAKEARRHRS